MHDLVEVDAADEEDGGEREHDEEAKPGGTDTVVNVQGLRGRREEGIRGEPGRDGGFWNHAQISLDGSGSRSGDPDPDF